MMYLVRYVGSVYVLLLLWSVKGLSSDEMDVG